jgi:amino acid permease
VDLALVGVSIDEPEESGMSSTEAMFNCINILLGVGILSIPYALKEGGWAAVGVLALMWVSTNYTGKLIVECQQYYNATTDNIPKSIGMQGGVMKTCAARSLHAW